MKSVNRTVISERVFRRKTHNILCTAFIFNCIPVFCLLTAVVTNLFYYWIADGQVDFSSGGGSPSNSMSSPGVSMPPGGLFGQQHQPAAYPHLKGEDEPSEDITSMNEKLYEGIDCADLVEQLKDTDTLHEQADIIHYLYTTKYALWHLPLLCQTEALCKGLGCHIYSKSGNISVMVQDRDVLTMEDLKEIVQSVEWHQY